MSEKYDWKKYGELNKQITFRIPLHLKTMLSEMFDEYPLTVNKITLLALYQWVQSNKDWERQTYQEITANIELAKRLQRGEIEW